MKKSRRDATSKSHSSWAIKGSNDKSKHGIHFSLYLKLKSKVKASNVHGVPLVTANKIVVRHRLYTPTLNSATFQHSIANPSACFAMLPQPFRTIGKHSGANSGTVCILPRRIRLLRIGVGAYTATFRMPLREYMPNGPDGKVVLIY